MLKYICLFITCLFSGQLMAQMDTSYTHYTDDQWGEVYNYVETMPEFPGGDIEFKNFIRKNVKYPEYARDANIQGKVFASFIITKTGEVADIKIVRGLGYGLDEEVIRVLKRMPTWKPGTQNGLAVNVKFQLPVSFKLQ